VDECDFVKFKYERKGSRMNVDDVWRITNGVGGALNSVKPG